MNMIEKKAFSVLSTDGVHKLRGVVYLPNGEARGLFHVVHGMTEHIARDDKFLADMARAGFISFGYDNLGHGNTARDDSELGYIAKEKGWELLARDVAAYSDAVRAEFGNGDMPYYLLGHSMGSFIARLAAQRFVKPSRLIIMGTGGPNPAANLGLALIGVIKRVRGERHFSPLVDFLIFGGYNKKFGKATDEDKKLWLTNDESVRRVYYADKFCTFNFTVSAMGDLVRLLKYTNSAAWYREIPSDMPILLISGEYDPVGNYGKGIRQVEKRLKKCQKDVSCKLYEGARHEILNDFTYTEVRDDIIKFLQG